MSIRELTWQIKQVVLEAQNFTSILPSLRIFSLKTYEISDLGQLRTRLVTRPMTKHSYVTDFQNIRLVTGLVTKSYQVLRVKLL